MTTTEIPVSCPPSAVHEMITTWTDGAGTLLVFPGDLVLRDYRMEIVTGIWYDPAENLRVRVEYEGRYAAEFADPADPVALIRYDTGEGAAADTAKAALDDHKADCAACATARKQMCPTGRGLLNHLWDRQHIQHDAERAVREQLGEIDA